MATEDKSPLSPLSPQDQRESDTPQNNQMERDVIKHLRDRGYKVTEEYNNTGQLSKVSGESRDRFQVIIQILGALAIPLAITLATALFSYQQNQTSFQVATDQQRETTLRTYIDNMSDLLLNHKLRESKPDDEVRVLARARTLSALGELDPKRKSALLKFLYEAQLIKYGSAIINLKGADLSDADLSDADLSRTDLSGANLSGANLSGADLFETNLSGANLRDATVTQGQLDTAKSLQGATMPDGSKHP